MRIYSLLCICLVALSGCASVKVSSIDSQEYLNQRRGDVLSQGYLSEPSNTVTTALGLSDCENRISFCIKEVQNSTVTDVEDKLSALSEMWLYRGMQAQKDAKILGEAGDAQSEKILASKLVDYYLQAARYAYAYLFYSGTKISSRALEDRQTQVKDYYNFAVQNAIEQLYKTNKGKPFIEFPIKEGGWEISLKSSVVPEIEGAVEQIKEMVPDTVLSFEGLKNQYTNDGLGARMVLSFKKEDKNDKEPWRLMPYSSVTAMITFPGENLDEVLSTTDALITTYDPTVTENTVIAGVTVPLSANFSGAYGLWLANSDFASTSLSTIFGRGTIIDKPTVYLMRTYRKDLRTVILIHGLASSPEAWVNTANEIMGDKKLRDNYQIWQIYYPTNVPLLINRFEIAQAINKTIDHFDSKRKNRASKDITLIGHSMGGILSRLLVSDSGDVIVTALEEKYPQTAERMDIIEKKYGPIMKFGPLQGVNEAIFLAAPHRGTPYADASWAKYLASFVKLPLSIVNVIGEMTLTMFGKDFPREISMTGVDNLSAKDPTIKILQNIPISPHVTYYSIIGRKDMDEPLKDSSDGIVPYWSSHLDGAKSEKVILSGHSVQETPEAILEIRKILRENLNKPVSK